MAVEVKLTGKPLDQRIADRLRSSGEATNPDVRTQQGDGPTRVHTHIHHSPNKARGSGESER
jgi:hypothetical protein